MRTESRTSVGTSPRNFPKTVHHPDQRSETGQATNSILALIEKITKQLQAKEKFLVAKQTKDLKNQELLAVINRLKQIKIQVRNPGKDRFFLDVMVAYKNFLELSPRINFFYYNSVDNLTDSGKICSEKITEILKILVTNKLNFQKMLEEKNGGETSSKALELVKIEKLNALIGKNDNRIAELSEDKKYFASTKVLSILEIIKIGSQRLGFEFSQIYRAKITEPTEFEEFSKYSYRVFSKKVLEEIKIAFSNLDELVKRIRNIQKICRKILSEIPEINEIYLSKNFPGEKEIIKMNTALSGIKELLSKIFKIENSTSLDFNAVLKVIHSIIENEKSLDQLENFFCTLVEDKINLQQLFLRFDWLEPELQKLQKISDRIRGVGIGFAVFEDKDREEVISQKKIKEKIRKKMTVLEKEALFDRSDEQEETTKRIQSAFFTDLEALKEQKNEMQSQIKIIRKNKELELSYGKFKKNYLNLDGIKTQIQQGERLISEVRDEVDALLFPTENLAQSIFSCLQKIKSSQIKFEIKAAKEEKISLYQESQNFRDKRLSPIGEKVIGLEKSILASQDIWRLASAQHTARVAEPGLPGETELAQLKEELLASLRPLQRVLGLPDSTKELLSTILIDCKAYMQQHASDEIILTQFLQTARDTHKKWVEIVAKMEPLKEKVEKARAAAVRQQKISEEDSHKPQKKNRRFKKKLPLKGLVKQSTPQSGEPTSTPSVATQADPCVPSGLQVMPLQGDRLLLRTPPKKPVVPVSDSKYSIFSKSFAPPKPLYAALDQFDQKTLAKDFQGLLESKIEWKSDLSPEVSAQCLKLMNYHQCALLMKFAQFYESLRRGHYDAFLSAHKANIGLIQIVRNQIFHAFPIIIAANWSKISTDPQQQISFYREIFSMTCSLRKSIATGDFTELARNSFFDKYSKATDLLPSLKVPLSLNRELFHYFVNFNQNFPTDFSLPDQVSAKKELPPDTIQLAQDFITSVQDTYGKEAGMPRENQAARVRHSVLGMTT